MSITTLHGDCREMLKTLPDKSVQCVVTSPPYFGLRRYSDDPREIGQEKTPAEYVATMVAVFREVKRVLRDDGVLFLNLGDSYAGSWGNYAPGGIKNQQRPQTEDGKRWERKAYGDTTTLPATARVPGLPEKNLIGIPWRVAFALQDDGWILRSDIIWHKPNAMPESVQDRPTRAHEYIFLFSKSPRYFYDAAAIAEPAVDGERFHGAYAKPGVTQSATKSRNGRGDADNTTATRNRRTVWTVSTKPFSGVRLAADYVDADGKPYKASADCPIHSHLAKKQTGQTQQYDALQDRSLSRNAGTQTDRAPSQVDEQSASSHRANYVPARPSEDDLQAYSSLMQTTESTSGRKMSALPTSADGEAAETHAHTSRSYSQQTHPADDSDYSRPASLDFANGHNTQSHRTGHAPENDLSGTPFVEMADDTQYTPSLPAFFEQQQSTPASNSAAGFAQDDLFSRMGIDIPSTQIATSPSPVVMVRNGSTKHYTCVCEPCQVDHYATFPEALIEPCILAGSAAQACEVCGAPWRRVVEREAGAVNIDEGARQQVRSAGARTGGTQKVTLGVTEYVTRRDLGFAPSCTCDGNTGAAKCVVLDPFAGSGTVGRVAMRYQRHAVLCELNAAYIEDHIEKRTDGVQVELFV
jgi:DNA modification methylase